MDIKFDPEIHEKLDYSKYEVVYGLLNDRKAVMERKEFCETPHVAIARTVGMT